MNETKLNSKALGELAARFRAETLRIHAAAPETRVASSLSAVEIYTGLFYGGMLRHNPANPRDPARDRLIVSKGHGSISLYPIMADRSFFPKPAMRPFREYRHFRAKRRGRGDGLVLEGYRVAAYAIAPFITMRCLEQIWIHLAMPLQIRPMGVTLPSQQFGHSR